MRSPDSERAASTVCISSAEWVCLSQPPGARSTPTESTQASVPDCSPSSGTSGWAQPAAGVISSHPAAASARATAVWVGRSPTGWPVATTTRSRAAAAAPIRSAIASRRSRVRPGSMVSPPTVYAGSGDTPHRSAISASTASGVQDPTGSSPKRWSGSRRLNRSKLARLFSRGVATLPAIRAATRWSRSSARVGAPMTVDTPPR